MSWWCSVHESMVQWWHKPQTDTHVDQEIEKNVTRVARKTDLEVTANVQGSGPGFFVCFLAVSTPEVS